MLKEIERGIRKPTLPKSAAYSTAYAERLESLLAQCFAGGITSRDGHEISVHYPCGFLGLNTREVARLRVPSYDKDPVACSPSLTVTDPGFANAAQLFDHLYTQIFVDYG